MDFTEHGSEVDIELISGLRWRESWSLLCLPRHDTAGIERRGLKRTNMVKLVDYCSDPTLLRVVLTYDSEGYRELTQRYAFLGGTSSESQLYAVIPSYVLVSNRKLVSGLTFAFSDGHSIDIGYVVDR